LATRLGIPPSASFGLIGGLVGAGLVAGTEALAEAIVGVSHRVWFSVLEQA
jgi:phosphate/sulfate permease